MTSARDPRPANPPPAGRRRRTREQVTARIRAAARTLFAERGYAAATTKEIAGRAEASEALLFRYYGSKASLFDDVVSAPFNELMRQFVSVHADPAAEATRASDAGDFVRAVYFLLEENRDLLAALVTPSTQRGGDRAPRGLHGLEGYFEQAVAQLEQQRAASGSTFDFDPRIGVRLGFGMIAASVLLRDWLFPDGAPNGTRLAATLERMVAKALDPVGAD